MNPSRYNKDVYIDQCKICNKKTDLHCHHIIFQHMFGEDHKFPFDKNIASNLCVLCENCHHRVHKGDININGYIQTTNGIQLQWNETNPLIKI